VSSQYCYFPGTNDGERKMNIGPYRAGLCKRSPIAVARVRSRLYLGKDHLLRVSASWVENYRRFYFNDIEAVIVSRTNRGLILEHRSGGLCAGFLFWYVETNDHTGRIIMASTASFFGLFLLVNVLYGQTCECEFYKKLRVGANRCLRSRRLRIANKVLALLKRKSLLYRVRWKTIKFPEQLANWQTTSTARNEEDQHQIKTTIGAHCTAGCSCVAGRRPG